MPVDVSVAPATWTAIPCQSTVVQEPLPVIHDVDLSHTVAATQVPVPCVESVTSTRIEHAPIQAPSWKSLGASPWQVQSRPLEFGVACRSQPAPTSPTVSSTQDLGLVEHLPVTRRLHGIQAMSGDHWLYWLTRLARSRRLPTGRVHLIGIVPDVPLDAEQPVSWQADRQVIVFTSNPHVHIPSTVVIGVDRETDQWLIGRFY